MCKITGDTVAVFSTRPDYTFFEAEMDLINSRFNQLLCENNDNANPYGFLIKPGQKVVIKPNWVRESHLYNSDWTYVITHVSVLEMILKNVLKALQDTGEICIIDAPQTDSDYTKIIQSIRLNELIDKYRKLTHTTIVHFDIREERWFFKGGITVGRKKLPGDPLGYARIDLGADSEFVAKRNKEYYGADYDMQETRKYHNQSKNIYIISKTVLSADVFINVPKLKTHKLGGVTASLKNIVGTCVIKNSLPHHTIGTPENGGDRYQAAVKKNIMESNLKQASLFFLKFKNPLLNYPFILIKGIAGKILGSPQGNKIRNGSWHGNDTIWRTTLDLNKILLYADRDGIMRPEIQRGYLTVIDGIIGGEKNGPMAPDPKYSGILIGGTDPVLVDTVAATLMGFDYTKIPTINNAYAVKKFRLTPFRPDDILVKSNNATWLKKISEFKKQDTLHFEPHFGWKDHIEMNA